MNTEQRVAYEVGFKAGVNAGILSVRFAQGWLTSVLSTKHTITQDDITAAVEAGVREVFKQFLEVDNNEPDGDCDCR